MSNNEHICGLQGYDPMIDPPCPGCQARRKPGHAYTTLNHEGAFSLVHELIDLGKFDCACENLHLIAQRSLPRGDSLKLFECWDKLRARERIAQEVLSENLADVNTALNPANNWMLREGNRFRALDRAEAALTMKDRERIHR